jgi:hypothetical protein
VEQLAELEDPALELNVPPGQLVGEALAVGQ